MCYVQKHFIPEMKSETFLKQYILDSAFQIKFVQFLIL